MVSVTSHHFPSQTSWCLLLLLQQQLYARPHHQIPLVPHLTSSPSSLMHGVLCTDADCTGQCPSGPQFILILSTMVSLWLVLHCGALEWQIRILTYIWYSNRNPCRKTKGVICNHCQLSLVSDSARGDKVSMLTQIYPHKPLRKIEVTICNHQADSLLSVWPNVWSGDLQV